LQLRKHKEEITDYRDYLIKKRLSRISFTVFVGSGKGGVGKSLIAATTGLLLSNFGLRAALLDLDMHGPSSSMILNITELPREEKEGLSPPSVDNLKVMSIGLFVKEAPLPLSGEAKREALKELLAITDFGHLDYLIVDLPPGTGDESLAAINLITNNRGVILVSSPSLLSLQVVRRAAIFFKDMKVKIIGLIENMVINERLGETYKLAEELGIPFLGYIPYDMRVAYVSEKIDPAELVKTEFAEALKKALMKAKIID
jgi:ATP-binding protein involved in chromosome partitioning